MFFQIVTNRLFFTVIYFVGETPENEIKDEEGRPLLKEKDLVPKNNIAVNELVPRTLTKQIDVKATNWETTYDVINKAPFKPEPLSNFNFL